MSKLKLQLLKDFKLHRLQKGPSKTIQTDKDEMLNFYKQMTLIRRMEMACDTLYKSKYIRGFCHLATGQEAIPVGMEAALTKEDAIITAYRCHGFTFTRGQSIQAILSELLGRRDGVSKGKGGSMHMFGQQFYGGNGIVGAQVPVGAGIAFAQKYRKTKNVTFALYGDGAANQGQVFEAYNMAKLMKLPCIFVCENNEYGMGTSTVRSSASSEYFTRGDYIPGIQVNGMDVFSVKEACSFAKEFVLENGPLVMEMKTYRYGGHSMSDPGTTYRTREEIQRMRSTMDCISGLKKQILDNQVATANDLKLIEDEAKEEVQAAVEFAKKSPEPDPSELFTDIVLE